MKLLAFCVCIFAATAFASAKEQSALSQELQNKHQEVAQLRENILNGKSGAHANSSCESKCIGGGVNFDCEKCIGGEGE